MTHPITSKLKSKLDALTSDFMENVPTKVRVVMDHADVNLMSSGIINTALKAGDVSPDFALNDVYGHSIQLSNLLRKGPVVLSFYRGGWCPYCNLELRALQEMLPKFCKLGATLIAISPQMPDESLTTAEKNKLSFYVLSDPGSQVAKKYGLTFYLAKALRPIYGSFGHRLPDINGDDSWLLPLPATYVIGTNGVIQFAFIDTDYRNRLEPDLIVDVLTSIMHAKVA